MTIVKNSTNKCVICGSNNTNLTVRIYNHIPLQEQGCNDCETYIAGTHELFINAQFRKVWDMYYFYKLYNVYEK